ncbi:pinensin family lanthipeptide [Rhodocytophaga aerolata]|uniref:Pinensin family lanthipeptide n=1 Tax=Rhodocytophaga aerolata TaxID=455078 RepID=A0ABT8R7J2_9BACT|nr:pinensin family lanthipeptide [Rhodocytophaga aerolata]MDO1446727.1 pinensin family lanthipeptide [Rhodocytophaga aerolata]
MKHKKLKLAELNIQSFVTSFEEKGDTTIHGGLLPASYIDGCRSALIACYPIQTLALCPIRTLNNCGSFLDACPSAISCPFDFDGLTIQ